MCIYFVIRHFALHVDSISLEKKIIQPEICKPAMKNANTKRILVRGMMLVGVFQCLTVRYIARGAVTRVKKYKKKNRAGTTATIRAMVS